MRASLLTLAVLSMPTIALAAPPLHVRVSGAHARIGQAQSFIARNHLLTSEQLACATIVPGRLGSPRVRQISVFEQHGGVCPGDATPPTFLFDLYVDTVSGVVDYTPEEQSQLQTILPFIPAED